MQKKEIGDVIYDLMTNEKFSEFFFSTEFPEISKSSRTISELLKKIPVQQNTEIIKKIISNPEFKNYYINSNIRRIRDILSAFLTETDLLDIQDEMNDFIINFEGKDRICAIRLLYRHITNLEYKEAYKKFIGENFALLNEDDIFDFAFDDMLEITTERATIIKNEAIDIYRQQQKLPFRSQPDPLKAKLELVYILYITEKIDGIEDLQELSCVSVFLQFFLDSENFDYGPM